MTQTERDELRKEIQKMIRQYSDIWGADRDDLEKDFLEYLITKLEEREEKTIKELIDTMEPIEPPSEIDSLTLSGGQIHVMGQLAVVSYLYKKYEQSTKLVQKLQKPKVIANFGNPDLKSTKLNKSK